MRTSDLYHKKERAGRFFCFPPRLVRLNNPLIIGAAWEIYSRQRLDDHKKAERASLLHSQQEVDVDALASVERCAHSYSAR